MEPGNEDKLILDELLAAESTRLCHGAHGGSLGQYTKHYGTWKRARNIVRYFLEESNRVKTPLRIADIGCGDGLYVWLFNNIPGCRQAEFRGIDISEARICLGKRMLERSGIKNVSFFPADAADTKLPDAWADIVLCLEVMEHIKEPEKCLAEIKRILKPGGMVIITTPNKYNQARAVRWLFNPFCGKSQTNSSVPEEKDSALFDCHVSVNGLQEWIDIFNRAGFTVERTRRGSLFYGGAKYDQYPLLFGISLFLDKFLDLIPFARGITENLAFKLRKG